MNKSNLVRMCKALLFFSIIMPSFPANATLLDDIFSRTTAARDRAIEARNAARESRDNMREGRMALTGQVRDTINEAVSDLQEDIAERIAGRQAWLGNDCDIISDCGQFRGDIIMLVDNLATLSNSLFIVTELGIEIKGNRLKNVLETVPGRALYPLYRAFSQELNIFESNFVVKLQTAAVDLGHLELAVPTSSCEIMLEDREFTANAIRNAKILALGMKLVGKIFEAIGTKEIQKEGAVWGWVGVAFKNNRLKNVGIKIHAAGGALSGYGSVASVKLLRCIVLDDHQQIMASLEAFDPDVTNLDVAVSSRSSQDSVDGIQTSVDSLGTDVSTRASQVSVNGLGVSLAGLVSSIANRSTQESVDALAATLGSLDITNLDAAVSSRASQTSVDALTATIGTLDTGNLDAAVSSRASQDSINAFGEGLADQNSIILRIQIEQQLRNKHNAISTFYLPEEFGGLLELVREVVVDTLNQNEAAGISLNKAGDHFQDGEIALITGDYKRAYKKYQKAYLKVVKNSKHDDDD